MPRLRRSLTPALLVLLAVPFFDAGLTGARADNITDCTMGGKDVQIRACSRIIESGRLFGKPIDNYNLSILHANRGNGYRGKRQFDRAIAEYDKAIRINPSFADNYYNRAITYRDKGQIDRAIADYGHAIRRNPRHANAYYNRAIIYRDKRQFDRAIADYGNAIRLTPNDARAYNNRGVAYYLKGQYDRAIADYDRAIKLDPKGLGRYTNRGLAYEKLGRRDKALADFRRVIARRPGDRFARSGLDRLGAKSAGSISKTRRRPASAGCFGNNRGAASLNWNDHFNWAKGQNLETLKRDLSTKTRNIFNCAKVSRKNLNGVFADLSHVVGFAAPGPACFDGNRGAASLDFLGHHRWARSQPRDVLRNDIVWKVSSVLSCMNPSLWAKFFAKASVILAKAPRSGRWINARAKGDWPGKDFACTGGVMPKVKFCDSAHVGNVAVCWVPKDRQTGYPFKECQGQKSWCTYKSVNLSQRQTGSRPGQLYICSAN